MSGNDDDLEQAYEAIDDARAKADDISSYEDEASFINRRHFANEDEDNPTESPYGEELARLDGLAYGLTEHADALERAIQAQVPMSEIKQLAQELAAQTEEAGSTLEDCTPLPDDSSEDDLVDDDEYDDEYDEDED